MHTTGTFEAAIVDHGFGSSKNTKSPQFVVSFQTDEGPITGFFSMTDKAIEYTLEKIRNMGFDGADLGLLADGTALRGSRCQIVVKHETWEGVTRAKIDGVWPIGHVPGIQRDEAAAANVRRFNALLKKYPVTGQASDAPPRTSRKRPAEPSVDEFDSAMAEDGNPENIPF